MTSALKTAARREPPPVYDGPIFDADLHIQELNFDFMAKYLPKKYHPDWLIHTKNDDQGEFNLWLGDQKVDNAEIADGEVFPPGKLKEWLAALNAGKQMSVRIPISPDMYTLKGRVEKLDEFGVEACLLFVGLMISTFGWLFVTGEKKGFEGACAALHAYNEYMLDEWTFNYQDRVYSTPILSLWDLDWALKEARWLIDNGAKVVTLPPGPGMDGRAPADSTTIRCGACSTKPGCWSRSTLATLVSCTIWFASGARSRSSTAARVRAPGSGCSPSVKSR